MIYMITIDQQIAAWFNSNFRSIDPSYSLPKGEWHYGNLILCLIALILSIILCGAIGLEREKRGRSAGLRTHLLVGVGSAIIMVISIYGFPSNDRDIARLAAQAVAGVGFLGAGTIIHHHGGIKGLTTASTIWLSMAIGLACGSMNFILAILSALVVIAVLVGLRSVERSIEKTNPTIIVLAKENIPVISIIIELAKKYDVVIAESNTQIVRDGTGSIIEVVFNVFSNNKHFMVDDFTKELEEKTNAINIQILNRH